MKLIKVPKVSPKAYNTKRPASDLLRRQVAQLQHVVETVRGYGALTMPAKKVKTEGHAARFIAEATRALHPEGAAPAAQPTTPTPARARASSRPKPPKAAGSRRTKATRRRQK